MGKSRKNRNIKIKKQERIDNFPLIIPDTDTGPFADIYADPDLLKLAKEKGFDDHNNSSNEAVSNLFFNGGTIVCKDSIDPEYKKKALVYLKTLLRSFSPKHEDKMAVCGMVYHSLTKGF